MGNVKKRQPTPAQRDLLGKLSNGYGLMVDGDSYKFTDSRNAHAKSVNSLIEKGLLKEGGDALFGARSQSYVVAE